MSPTDVFGVACWLGFLWFVIVLPLWREYRINRKADRWLRAMDDVDERDHDRLLAIGGRSLGPAPGLERDRFEDEPAWLDESLPDWRWRR